MRWPAARAPTARWRPHDSLLDADLLLAADHAWRPGHGELADVGWTARHVTALEDRGVAAGETILRELIGQVRNPRPSP